MRVSGSLDGLNSDPYDEYNARLKERSAALQRLERRDRLISTLRLCIGLVTAVLLWLIFVSRLVSLFWLLVPLALFTILAILHEKTIRQKASVHNAVRFYRNGINRITDRWFENGNPGQEFLDESHLYAADLDLFGKGSLFQLLSIARTQTGEKTLASWLCQTSSREVIQARQSAVEDLRMRLDLREELARLGEDIRVAAHTDLLMRWSNSPPLLPGLVPRLIAPLLVVLTTLAFARSLLLEMGNTPVFIFLFLEAGFGLIYRRRVRRAIGQIEQPKNELKLLSRTFERVEKEEFNAPKLREIQARLRSGDISASGQIARLSRLVDRLDDRRNAFFRPLSYLLLWTTQIAFAIEAWRRDCGPAVERWLAAMGELEALSSLAAYAYEHPGDPFPKIVEQGPCFTGEELGHPLLPQAKCVRNSIQLDPDLRLMIVSGSNMSGKTTLLRTVGVNAVLAMVGAPVRARRLKLSPLVIGATLRIHDSLQEGKSRFYAEILRLREIVERARNSLPVLFLLDEILHGTNSHDRLIGAESVIRTLIETGAIGLVTTHDLALTRIAESLTGPAANVHFQDQLIDGQIIFDYQMHPGIVQKSNALDLMRSIGLKV